MTMLHHLFACLSQSSLLGCCWQLVFARMWVRHRIAVCAWLAGCWVCRVLCSCTKLLGVLVC